MGDDTKVDLKTPPPANDVIISSPPESQSANESEEKESANQNPDDEASEAVNWWSGWGNTTKWAKTITGLMCLGARTQPKFISDPRDLTQGSTDRFVQTAPYFNVLFRCEFKLDQISFIRTRVSQSGA